MATNYYITKKAECSECGQEYNKQFHVGKQSAGWKFLFQKQKFAATFEEWRKELKHREVFDDYGDWYTFDEFLKQVSLNQGYTHNTSGKPFYVDKKGYEFCDNEFS